MRGVLESQAAYAAFIWIKLLSRRNEHKNFLYKFDQEEPDSPSVKGHHSIDEEMQLVLRRLLKKADPEELRTLQRIFCGESQSAKWRVAFTELIEAMQRSVDN